MQEAVMFLGIRIAFARKLISKQEPHYWPSSTEPNWSVIEHLHRNILNYIFFCDNSRFNREHNSILSQPRSRRRW